MISLNEDSQTKWRADNAECLRYEYDLSPTDVVIDIGAYHGEWASQIFCRYGCQMVVVEPGPWIVGFPCAEVVNKAAWIHDGKLKFGGAYYYSSSYEKGETEYECFDINPLLSRYDEIALVKMNIEGSEYSLLKHIIGAGLHTRIKNLQVQFHRIEDQPVDEWYSEIEQELLKSHQTTFKYAYCWESWQRA